MRCLYWDDSCSARVKASDVGNGGIAEQEDEEYEGDEPGGRTAFEAAQDARIQAIRAWKAYKHAQRTLMKVRVHIE